MSAFLLALIVLVNPAADTDLEQRVMKLSEQFRCLVCQNETIADSQADLAADLRQQIREQMVAGRTDAEITSFLTDRYGDFVLYRPRVTPKTWLLWFGPFVLLAGGLAMLYGFLKRWPRSATPLTAADHRKVEEILKRSSDPNVAIYREQFAEITSAADRDDIKRRLLEDNRE